MIELNSIKTCIPHFVPHKALKCQILLPLDILAAYLIFQVIIHHQMGSKHYLWHRKAPIPNCGLQVFFVRIWLLLSDRYGIIHVFVRILYSLWPKICGIPVFVRISAGYLINVVTCKFHTCLCQNSGWYHCGIHVRKSGLQGCCVLKSYGMW